MSAIHTTLREFAAAAGLRPEVRAAQADVCEVLLLSSLLSLSLALLGRSPSPAPSRAPHPHQENFKARQRLPRMLYRGSKTAESTGSSEHLIAPLLSTAQPPRSLRSRCPPGGSPVPCRAPSPSRSMCPPAPQNPGARGRGPPACVQAYRSKGSNMPGRKIPAPAPLAGNGQPCAGLHGAPSAALPSPPPPRRPGAAAAAAGRRRSAGGRNLKARAKAGEGGWH